MSSVEGICLSVFALGISKTRLNSSAIAAEIIF